MKKLIIDCDNTFGIEGCDLDDGLAIIYSLGSGACDLLGVTTTFGNNTLDVIYPNTVQFMRQIGCEAIPVLKGHESEAGQNEAARFLAETVNSFPGEISILAIGSLTNLYHAWQLDADFFEKVPELSLMGGVTEPLIICGKQLDELNFACNHRAAFHVLKSAASLKIATGNNCLDALFSKERFDKMEHSDEPFLRWLHSQGQYWFRRENEVFGHDGIYKWDIYAAAALLFPQMFHENIVEISPDLQSLESGFLLGQGGRKKAGLPILKDSISYIDHVYETYSRFARGHGKRVEG
ncbi:MAG: nucleoside hydrolase [Spirochaetes bacterium]|nr:nucleoside hydrolase [Spirochaetota bacterium]